MLLMNSFFNLKYLSDMFNVNEIYLTIWKHKNLIWKKVHGIVE